MLDKSLFLANNVLGLPLARAMGCRKYSEKLPQQLRSGLEHLAGWPSFAGLIPKIFSAKSIDPTRPSTARSWPGSCNLRLVQLLGTAIERRHWLQFLSQHPDAEMPNSILHLVAHVLASADTEDLIQLLQGESLEKKLSGGRLQG
jgi:hypothetical protein